MFAAVALLVLVFLLDITFGFRLVGRRDTLLLNAGMVLITVAILALFVKHTKRSGTPAR